MFNGHTNSEVSTDFKYKRIVLVGITCVPIFPHHFYCISIAFS